MRSLLVVEDDVDLRNAICLELSCEGYAVTGAANGREALRLLDELPTPDLILLDMMMPVMNGWEFRARQLCDPKLAAIPVLAMTAAVELADDAFAGIPLVRKPLDIDRLLRQVEQRLNGETSAESPQRSDSPSPSPWRS